MKFGLICEGVTDFHVLKHVIKSYFSDADINDIQPELDARQMGMAENEYGSWEQVATYLQTDQFEVTVANSDYVVVQIDTDVCEHVNFGVSPISLANTDHDAFYEAIKQKLIAWMDSYEAGIAWLEYLCSDKNEIIKHARQLWEQYREPLIDGHSEGHIIRVANTFALIATAGELATQAGITGWKNGTAFSAIQAVFKQWLGSFDRVGNYEDLEILAQIKAFFEAHGNSRFESMTPDVEHLDKVINRVGYWKIENGEKKYLVYPEQFKKELCKGLNPKHVGKLLIQRGWLDHLNNGKSTKLTRGIDGMPKAIPMYVFNEKVLTDDLDEL